MMNTFNIFKTVCVSSTQCSYCSVYQAEGLNAFEAFPKSELCIVSFEKECVISVFLFLPIFYFYLTFQDKVSSSLGWLLLNQG